MECLREELVDDGLDDEEPFFLKKRLVVFFHMVDALFLTSIPRVLNWQQGTQTKYGRVEFLVYLGLFLMDELKLEVGSNGSRGFELRAQEHEQRVG
jgi:hypothetical protein